MLAAITADHGKIALELTGLLKILHPGGDDITGAFIVAAACSAHASGLTLDQLQALVRQAYADDVLPRIEGDPNA